MLIYLTLFILIAVFITNMFSGGGSARALRELFYGNYYAEDAVTSPDDVPNSKECVEKCIEAGIGIKTEAYITKDRRAVVSTYNNLSKEYGIDKSISDCDLDELEGYGIMSVPALIELVAGRTPLIIELKNGDHNESLCRYTADAIKASGYTNIGVVSFHSGIVSWFKEKEKKIFRGSMSAPAKDFKSLSALDRFVTGNLANNSVSRPQFVLYRNKPLSIFVKFVYSLGIIRGTWTITDAAEGERLEEDRDMIVCRGFMPANPHYRDLPARVKTQAEIDADKKWEERQAKRMARAERKVLKEMEKEEKRARKNGTFKEKTEEALDLAEEVIEDITDSVEEAVENAVEKIAEE